MNGGAVVVSSEVGEDVTAAVLCFLLLVGVHERKRELVRARVGEQ